MPRAVSNLPVGEEIEIDVIRDGRTRTLEATIGELDESRELARVRGHTGGGSDFGLHASDLTPSLAARFGLEESSGVVVSRVTPDGPAADAA